ncbi:MAG: hypothetical protein PUE01_02010 [Clostridiaceae bacterium]|nr:hypothetical protein [Clostridiaceae bacterium]
MKQKRKIEPIFGTNIDWKGLGICLSALCILHIIECLITLQSLISLFSAKIQLEIDFVTYPHLIFLLLIAISLGTSIGLILYKKKRGLTLYIIYAILNLLYTFIFTEFDILSLLIIVILAALMIFFTYRKKEIFV